MCECWGAQGDANGTGVAGKGGYSLGFYNGGEVLYVCVGGKNSYNGGGTGPSHGRCGGGATHIAITNNRGVLSSYKDNQSEILLVAGGGGGANDLGTGGAGGGTSGGSGEQVTYEGVIRVGATGGTQSSGGTFSENIYSQQVVVNGSFGQGGYSYVQGASVNDAGGGGGGGWYGGGGTPKSGCGGGGSGHINTNKIKNGSMQNGKQSGNGKALITWMPVL